MLLSFSLYTHTHCRKAPAAAQVSRVNFPCTPLLHPAAPPIRDLPNLFVPPILDPCCSHDGVPRPGRQPATSHDVDESRQTIPVMGRVGFRHGSNLRRQPRKEIHVSGRRLAASMACNCNGACGKERATEHRMRSLQRRPA